LPGTGFAGIHSQLGYKAEYYDNAADHAQAKSLLVVAGQETAGVNFGLSQLSSGAFVGARVVGAPWLAGPGAFRRRIEDHAAGWPDHGAVTSESPVSAGAQDLLDGGFADIAGGHDFIDPYRGIKIELIEKTGSGPGAAVLLRVSLSGLQTDCGAILPFGQVPLGSRADRTITFRNASATSISLGQSSLGGRNGSAFAITQDGCSGQVLAASHTCSIGLSFAPQALSSTSGAGELAVLRIPSSNPLRSKTAVSLYGMAEAVDFSITKSRVGEFRAGEPATYRLRVGNQGTVTSSGTITVVDQLPPGITFVSATSSTFTCSNQGQTVTCTWNVRLCPRCFYDIDLNVSVQPGLVGSVVNTATVSGPDDANPSNNSAEDRAELKPGRQPRPPRRARSF